MAAALILFCPKIRVNQSLSEFIRIYQSKSKHIKVKSGPPGALLNIYQERRKAGTGKTRPARLIFAPYSHFAAVCVEFTA